MTRQRLIRPLEREWRDTAPTRTAIEPWEKASGLTLPEDYRAFMLRYDDGRVWPLMFDYTIPRDIYPTSDPTPTTYLDPL
jgi:hypothetical protein